MTQFTISPRFYPAYALPMLFITLIVATLLPKLTLKWENWKKPQIPNLHRRSKQKTAHDTVGKNLNDGSIEKKSYPPVSMKAAIGEERGSRGRSLEKSASNASLKHHTRRNSLQGSLHNKKGLGDGSPTRKKEKDRIGVIDFFHNRGRNSLK